MSDAFKHEDFHILRLESAGAWAPAQASCSEGGEIYTDTWLEIQGPVNFMHSSTETFFFMAKLPLNNTKKQSTIDKAVYAHKRSLMMQRGAKKRVAYLKEQYETHRQRLYKTD